MNNHDIKECWKLNGKPDKGKQRFNNNRSIRKPGNLSEQTNRKQAANSAQAETDKETEEIDINDTVQKQEENKENFKFAYSTSFLNNKDSRSIILADSGATSHIFVDKSRFTDYKEIEPVCIFTTLKDSYFEAIGIGNVPLIFNYRDTQKPIILHNVLHAPSTANNLISTGILDADGLLQSPRQWSNQDNVE